MKLTKLLLTTLLISTAAFFGCQKEFSTDPDIINPALPAFTPNITTTVQGRVVDEINKPVQGAFINSGGTNATTNINGEFTLNNINAYDQATFIQVKKQGYFGGSRTIIASQGAVQFVEIKLIPNQSIGTINMASGGTVTLANGTSVTLPASSVVVASTNAPYAGIVSVSLGWIDPTSNDLEREMPGDLRGINALNAEVGLQSFGMVAVELKGASGEKLQIAAGKKAAVKFFLPASIAASAPNEIPLWSFNETTGLWKQEGTAVKSGTFYNAEVSHFSFWNCDAQFPVVNFKATIKYQNGEPVKNKLVKIKRTATAGFTYGRTDTAGVVRGLVPPNEPLVLEIMSECNTILHSQNIGPFSTAANITVTVTGTTLQSATITGIANTCAGSPVVSGIADLITGQRTYRTSIINGAFNFNINVCGASQSATVVVIDTANGQQNSSIVTLSAGPNNVGSIAACGTSFTQFINFTLSGTSYSLLGPADSLFAYFNPQGGRTNIGGYSFNSGTISGKRIDFTFAGDGVGNKTLTSLFVSTPTGTGNLQQNVITASITEYGSAGGFITGSFSGNISDSFGVKTIQCTFKVKR